MTTSVIEVYADVVCPFTHVGLHAFRAARAEAGRSTPILVVRAWPLELVNGAPLDGPTIAPKVAALRGSIARGLFVAFAPERFPRTSLPVLASAAAAYRQSPETGEQFSIAVRDALFEAGEDIADADVLELVRRDLGVPAPNACDEQQVARDWAEGRRRGGRGSPHYFLPDGADYFCPLLEVEHRGNELEIRENEARFNEFIAAALGVERPARPRPPCHGWRETPAVATARTEVRPRRS
jgi:2-hydroxychromene-2-carboxylate isomerase